MNVKSGHLLIFVLAVLGVMVLETHYDDALKLISQVSTPAQQQGQNILRPPKPTFVEPQPQPWRYNSQCWFPDERDVPAVSLDPSRYKAVTERDGTPRLLELPVYREDILAPRAPMSVEFTDVNGNRWKLVFGSVALQKEGPVVGEVIREGGQVYFVQHNEDHTVCFGKWILAGQQ
ncbi:MAG: hypothetical protein UY85_C0027G0007 [Candidatus Peribacteria bacterium GW2011_GWB1_54_5]|nr:MAG: hypothetical protein UY85_C0027G0007 [Candidatus Peribacteria bacterium GW2011_GWB1_54_5]KKW40697.1 MAG: hypothetical protein UY87_C0014G0010 [Candidatus Peribacteria bacterium GW2011_GWC2_54_8]